jgi:hypothetical protein
MVSKFEQKLDGLRPPSTAEATALARRNIATSNLLDSFTNALLDGNNIIDIPLKRNAEYANPSLPYEFDTFLHSFLPQATSMNYRLRVSREYPKLSLIIARGMEDVASVQLWNKTAEVGVKIENRWTHIAQIGEAEMRLESMLQQGDMHLKRLNHLNMAQQIFRLAIRATQEE